MQTYLKQCRWGTFLLMKGDLISHHVDRYGEWVETEVDLFRYLLPSDGVCVEVGSDIGMHAIPLSRICERGHIVCYEPQRPIFHILCANVALNNRLNVYTRHAAVGERTAAVAVETSDYETPWNYGSFSLESGFSAETRFRGRVGTEQVAMVALDNDPALLASDRIDFLKIDVEGFERAVIRGAMNLIVKHRPDIFIEANNEAAVDQIIEELAKLGYIAYWFIPRRFREDNYNSAGFSPVGHVDGIVLDTDIYDLNMIFRHETRDCRVLSEKLVRVREFKDIRAGIPLLPRF